MNHYKSLILDLSLVEAFFALSSSGKEASTPNSALMATEQPLSYFVIWLLATLCRKEFFLKKLSEKYYKRSFQSMILPIFVA